MDGRHARRERGQRAVINAVFELIQEGNLTPSVEQVGARAQVSVATIFRNYGSLQELGRSLHVLFQERFAEYFLIPQIGTGPLDQRITRFCDARIKLHEAIWPFMRFMNVHIAEHQDGSKHLQRIRETLARQVKQQFNTELRHEGSVGAQNLAASIDALTSPESWALMQVPHSRSNGQIRRSWINALSALLYAEDEATRAVRRAARRH